MSERTLQQHTKNLFGRVDHFGFGHGAVAEGMGHAAQALAMVARSLATEDAARWPELKAIVQLVVTQIGVSRDIAVDFANGLPDLAELRECPPAGGIAFDLVQRGVAAIVDCHAAYLNAEGSVDHCEAALAELTVAISNLRQGDKDAREAAREHAEALSRRAALIAEASTEQERRASAVRDELKAIAYRDEPPLHAPPLQQPIGSRDWRAQPASALVA